MTIEALESTYYSLRETRRRRAMRCFRARQFLYDKGHITLNVFTPISKLIELLNEYPEAAEQKSKLVAVSLVCRMLGCDRKSGFSVR